MNAPFPVRGEIWMVDLPGGRGSEQHGRRPALVIQNNVGNRVARTTIVAVVTTTLKPYPVTVLLKKGEAGLREASMVNLSQVFTIDRGRLERRLGHLASDALARVNDAIRVSLDVH